MRGYRAVAAAGALLWALIAAAPSVSAEQWDPTVAVAAYSAALGAHDLNAALGLFHQFGSATDLKGHHFEGTAGLTEFLRGAGFDDPTATITTQGLHVVGNRAVWTYTCSCSAGSTEVRLVMNNDKISVFAMMPPPATPPTRTSAGPFPWLAAPMLVALAVLLFELGRGATRSATARPRVTHAGLLAALLESRTRRVPDAHSR